MPTPPAGYCGDGLLAVHDGTGTTHVFATSDPSHVPRIQVNISSGRCLVSADGPVEHARCADLDIPGALAGWADEFIRTLDLDAPRPAPTAWCSWYDYGPDVGEADILENLQAFEDHDLPVDVVQIDDGYQAEIGDWLLPGSRFPNLSGLIAAIRRHGRRAGIWVAPFLIGRQSALAQQHPDWLLPGGYAGHNWDQDLAILDLANAGAEQYLREVFETFVGLGIDYFKLDFCYAGAVQGGRGSSTEAIAAYRHGLSVIRQTVGDGYLLACGAPIFPSIGLVDAMRVSADTAPYVEPASGDLSAPGQRGAMLNGRARAWQNGRFWSNDPDCLIVRPEVHQREAWAEHDFATAGLRTVSDRIAHLDQWGLATTRAYLRGDSGPASRMDSSG